MFNVRPDALSPWLYVEPPPADEVPGFRMNSDGSVRDTPSAAPPWPFGFDPSAGSSSSMSPGLQDAMRFVPGNLYLDPYLTGLSGFAPPPRHPLQEALDQIERVYAPFAPKSSGPLQSQGSGTNIVSPYLGDEPRSRDALWSQSPVPIPSAPPVQSDGAPMTVGPLGSSSSGLTGPGPETETTPPQSLRIPDGLGSSLPWPQVNLPARFNSEPSAGQVPSTPEPVSLPTSTKGNINPSVASDGSAGVEQIPANDIQVAQATNRPGKPDQKPSAAPKEQRAAGEQELQVKATTQLSRLIAWDNVIRKPLPEKLESLKQKPLPDDWEGAVAKINPNYLKWTKAAAEKYGIPPELLARLINKESEYKPNAVSPKNAKGIAQLMPRAVEDLGIDPKTFDYFNAEKSINASAALLAKYYRHFKDWPKTVAAYNWGIGNLHNWLDGDKLAGPNDETQETLKHVFRGNPVAFDKRP